MVDPSAPVQQTETVTEDDVREYREKIDKAVDGIIEQLSDNPARDIDEEILEAARWADAGYGDMEYVALLASRNDVPQLQVGGRTEWPVIVGEATRELVEADIKDRLEERREKLPESAADHF
ncbi:hypothetical protein RYH80_18010 [Halobaculum sp. MBLA0147]|uniref:hypothetical protein n=1 Tax=Halobaculum sp. MBLA0147 TaxID=3079934 RepID=UPI0035231444